MTERGALVCLVSDPETSVGFDFRSYREATDAAVTRLARDLKAAGWTVSLDRETKVRVEL